MKENLFGEQQLHKSYFPKDNNYLFDVDENLTEWLRKYSKDPDETYVRGFLGRMLFSGDESLKQARCYIWWRKSKMCTCENDVIRCKFLNI